MKDIRIAIQKRIEEFPIYKSDREKLLELIIEEIDKSYIGDIKEIRDKINYIF